jgi:hypothetical protein
MFMQVIRGHVSDREQVHRELDRWASDIAPGTTGWLGTTAGVTEDGRLIVLARFESEADARRNSDRPEQDAWWTALSKNFTGEAEFLDSSDVVVDIVGDPDQAGFVQVIQGRVTDPDRARALMSGNSSAEWEKFRPDVIGSVQAGNASGAYVMAIYFTSESAARDGERKEPPPEIKAQMAEMDALNAEQPSFYDLTRPWLYSAR